MTNTIKRGLILDYQSVLRHLDHPEFTAPGVDGWRAICQGVINAAELNDIKMPESFPTLAFCGQWNNHRAQLGLLKLCFTQPEVLNISRTMGRQVITDADITCPRVTILLTSPWNNLDAVEALFGLIAEPDARELINVFISQYPELALVALCRLPKLEGVAGFLPRLPDLLQLSLDTDTITRNFILQQLWMCSPVFVVEQILAKARRAGLQPTSSILADEVSSALQALESTQSLQTSQMDVTERTLTAACADALKNQGGELLIAKLLGVLQKRIRGDQLAMERLNLLAQALLQAYPVLAAPSSPKETQDEEPPQAFPADIEEEANSYYERLYGGELSVPQVIEMLRVFRTSSKEREKQVYQCMVNNLFDEYKYFSGYPDEALHMTGTMFGSLIQNQLVTQTLQVVALRYVIEALKEPRGSKVFKFGLQALQQFKSRLPDMPMFCSHLSQIAQLEESAPDVFQIAKTHAKSSPGSPVGRLPTVTRSDGPQLFTALKLDTLLENSGEAYEEPSESVQDKILFIINNLSMSNMDQKVKEMKEVLRDEHVRWFSNYIVVKRASIEPNFHGLYVTFLDALNHPLVNRYILLETFNNIRLLLNSEKTASSSSERTLLKNLGVWLGAITLAKNRPIKHNNLAIKDLLIEAFDNNRLIVVIPFVCKVLEQCENSKVFKPPNPWLLAIMRLLSELYHNADLKLNLKFEIEVLCKRLKIDIKDIEPSTVLKERQPGVHEESQLAKEFEKISMGGAAFSGTSGFPMALSGQLQPHAVDVVDEGFNIGSRLTLNPMTPLGSQQSLRRIVQAAIERSIREVLAPVVERAVTIATISTRELIVKDFALEPSDEKMRRAAHLMAQSQASALASVTCKEPLRMSMFTNIRTMLLQNGVSEQAIPEAALQATVNDNLDVAVSVVEMSAAEKAIPEVDDAIASALLSRRKHREQTPHQPFMDLPAYTASRYPSTLPEMLRLKTVGLTTSQMRVYEDFSRVSRFVAPLQMDRPQMDRQERVATPPSAAAPLVPEGVLPYEQALEKIGHGITALDRLIAQTPNANLLSLPAEGDLRKILPQIPILVARSSNPDEAALVLSQKVVQLLYRNESPLSREVYILLLQRLCEISKRVAKEVTQWLLYAEDERKYNVPLYHAILASRILNVQELDVQLARLMEAGKINVVDFSCCLIRSCLILEPFGLVPADFATSLELLNRFHKQGKGLESLQELAEDLRKRNVPFGLPPAVERPDATPTLISPPLASLDPETAALREQLQQLFTDWVRLYFHPNTNEKTQAAYILQLQQHPLLQGENNLSVFIRICTEVSVDHYIRQKASGMAYQAVDAYARLIVFLLKYHIEPPGGFGLTKIAFVRKVLSLVLLVLVHAYEKRKGLFNQKPFFRLFSSLLYDLNTFQDSIQGIYFQILSLIG